MILKDNETINIVGGSSFISAAMVSAVAKVITTIYSFGQNLGTAIYRLIKKKHC